MKNNILKKSFRRGFTLIELMIVIVILGILMGTLLPRLTGSQARARDAARQADLNAITQAMELYYNDFGGYPGTAGTNYCLGATGEDTVSPTLKVYFKGENIPTPPQDDKVTLNGGSCTKNYMYIPLKGNGYLFAANVEIAQNANYNTNTGGTNTITFATDDSNTVASKLKEGPAAMITADETDPDFTVFIVAN